ncbi:aldo/keto reductase [Sphingomonas immobilis]|uniref:Aldo/keto reductase n=1 Tax=Sphingomonas immobilis TaxID=3063997 RepID=A0ABT8ZXK9_9SPHN|nr:aldo/keto reductase [Sphingomonas sp. CA1-15]MDO7842310.1 aldo/keto reductase [Sphingomonas sp. CA1-15]
METRFLGRSGLEVSVFGFGTMTFSDGEGMFGGVGATRGDDARRQIDMCVDAGVNLFDTADVYAAGRSEEILGQALGAKRKDVIVATKAFGRMGKGAHDTGLSRRHLIDACDASLKRLGTDWIDLYQVHSFDALAPLEETLRALDDLVTAGKVRYIGCSNFNGWHLMKASAIAERRGSERFIGQQIQYSLMVRDAEEELLPCGVDQGVGALIWSPLAQGFLSGKFRDGDSDAAQRLVLNGRLKSYDTPLGKAVVDALLEIAAAHPGASPSQVALNWLLARPGVSTVLLGARSDEQLADNLAAASWSLTADEVAALDKASQTGMRYPNSHHRLFTQHRNPQLFERFKD